ncbi:MAG: methyltransferase domain-containing protein [Desulfobacteraceae bacterium]|nr:MAG: methyltransferase domain-containing protein [Desulfobacteraceae bacterium]
MTKSDKIKWNQRHATPTADMEPSRILKTYVHLAKKGRALDIACGQGRNAVYLAEQGFRVDAVDISGVALARLKDAHPELQTIHRDLDTWQIPQGRYNLIINIRFMDRRLFPGIIKGLTSKGILIFESFISDNDDPYCLKPNELLSAFRTLRILFYEEKDLPGSDHFNEQVSLVAVKPE